FFSSSCYFPYLSLHSFPTRRSSDLACQIPRRLSFLPCFYYWKSQAFPFLLLITHLKNIELQIIRIPRSPQNRMIRRLSAELHLPDRKSTRLNSSHVSISYAVFCLKK